ncbi:flagellar hook-associated protein 3 FlgL [Peribacillus deserti]|uniref:Flagellar hook-associated protein 3 FlgL n=1 Tax=Peribacillus deserti TaxID=673318 RepID=A0ABS2QCJ9_9BACI|nr:flagellar hook-associated protein FlgL [Peribacillus deserti]MBM7690886.1 flagellar hook-associated protein 3 FlgL [Peribacillus deserti]
MRVTQNMLANSSLKHISSSYQRMDKYQDQLSTGKKITRPSDDPVVAMKGMFYRTNLTEVEQYKRNLSELNLWMENSDASLDQANSSLQRIRELVLQAKNGTNTVDERTAIATEIDQLKEDLVNVANSKVADKYIFNGTDVDKAPVTLTSGIAIVNANNEDFSVEVGPGVKIRANVHPGNVFSPNLFSDIEKLVTDLKADNTAGLDDTLTKLDGHLDNLSSERADLGARYNRLEMVSSRIDTQEVFANRVLSDNEDADIERVITDLKTQESVHRAALSVGAQIIQPTLMDFLR